MGRWRAGSLLLNHVATASKSLNPNFSRPLRPLHTSLPSCPTIHLLSLRPFSAIPSRVSVDFNELDSGPLSFDNRNEFLAKEDEETGKIPVKAYFLCTRLASRIPFSFFLFFTGFIYVGLSPFVFLCS
jgi:hypothetical protein